MARIRYARREKIVTLMEIYEFSSVFSTQFSKIVTLRENRNVYARNVGALVRFRYTNIIYICNEYIIRIIHPLHIIFDLYH